ncbi:MAG: NAD-dependent epimerase/dehydratase family protein [Acidobacteria bacterium]|nr:NAD-dependent epimerase/dehydratase family protein [Acidobacteriota bacterium]
MLSPLECDLGMVRTRTEYLWEEMRGQSVFLTGGTGFFGCWLVESFCHVNRKLNLDARMTILTRNPGAFANKCPHLADDRALRLLEGDVRSFNFPDSEYRFVIHAATEASAKQSTEAPLEMLSTIVDGTKRTLEFAVSHGTRAFLLTSSGAVYGKQPDKITHMRETYPGGPDPLDVASVYAEGKRLAEQLCLQYSKRYDLGAKIARCWAFCGPHLPLDAHFAIGNFIGDVLAGRPIEIKGDGTPRRSYLYAADLAVWLWTMLFRAPDLVPFNVGSAQDVSILELAELVTRTLGSNAEIRIAQKPRPGVEPARYVPCVDRAREQLGLEAWTPLAESIRRTADWYRNFAAPR